MRNVEKKTEQSISERFGADDLEAKIETIESNLDEIARRKREFVTPGWNEHFGPVLERAHDARRRQNEQLLEGRRILGLGQRVLNAGVLPPKRQWDLRQATRELLFCVGGGGSTAINEAIDKIESTKQLDQRSWPKLDRWDGAFSNPGFMLEVMDRVVEIIKTIDVSNLKPRPAAPEHPLAAAGGVSLED